MTKVINKTLWGKAVQVVKVNKEELRRGSSDTYTDPWEKFFKGRSVPVFEHEGDDTLGKEDYRLYCGEGESREVIEYKGDYEWWSSPGLEAGVDMKAHKTLAKRLAGTVLEGLLVHPNSKKKEDKTKLRDFYDAYTLPYVDSTVQADLTEMPCTDEMKEHYARLVYETKTATVPVKVAPPEKDKGILVASDWDKYENSCEYERVETPVLNQNRGLGAGMTRKKARTIYLAQPLADRKQLRQLCDLFKELVENAVLPEMEYLSYSATERKVSEHDFTSEGFKWPIESLIRIGKAAGRAFKIETKRMSNMQCGIVEDYDTYTSTNMEAKVYSRFSNKELEIILANAGLTEGERLAMYARYLVGMSVEETAKSLERTTTAIRVATCKALTKLRTNSDQVHSAISAVSSTVERGSDKKLGKLVDRLVEAIFGDDPQPEAVKSKRGRPSKVKRAERQYETNGRVYDYHARIAITPVEPVTSIVDNEAELKALWISETTPKGYETKHPRQWTAQDFADYEADQDAE